MIKKSLHLWSCNTAYYVDAVYSCGRRTLYSYGAFHHTHSFLRIATIMATQAARFRCLCHISYTYKNLIHVFTYIIYTFITGASLSYTTKSEFWWIIVKVPVQKFLTGLIERMQVWCSYVWTVADLPRYDSLQLERRKSDWVLKITKKCGMPYYKVKSVDDMSLN